MKQRCQLFTLSPQRGKNSPNCNSRFESLNRSSRRQEALTDLVKQMEPPDVGCYEVHGEGSQIAHASVRSRLLNVVSREPFAVRIPHYRFV